MPSSPAVLFFLSGFCCLLYQVVWLRLALAAFGVITPVISILLSTFMAGLALGSWAGGRYAAPLARRGLAPAKLYAAAEAVMALGAFLVPALFAASRSALLGLGEAGSFAYLALSGVMMGAAILPWCVCMGATFPLMLAHLEGTGRDGFGRLYRANVLGAMAGTLAAGFLLLEVLGFTRTLWVAALLNAAAAVIAFSLPARPGDAPKAEAAPSTGGRPHSADALLFITGFTSLAMEVVWTRQFTVVLGAHVYAFSLLLCVYLAATWAGASCYRRHLASGRPLERGALAAVLGTAALLPVLLNDPRLPALLGGGTLHAALALLSIVPFCAVLGYLTPSVIDAASAGEPGRAGRAYAVNVVGCILGPLAASYLLLPFLGVRLSLILLALPYAVWPLFSPGGLSPRAGSLAARVSAGLALAAVLFCTSYEEPRVSAVVRRDHTATVVAAGAGMSKELYVNGVSITRFTPLTKFMAHLPFAFHPGAPKDSLAICFGMGTTFRSLLSWGGQVTAVELVPSVRDLFGYFFSDAAQAHDGVRGRIVVDDGRRFLMRAADSYDVITIDPPPPIEAAGSSLLYSDEFYEVLKLRLRPDGVLQQWLPYRPSEPGAEAFLVAATARSLAEAFPHVRVFRSIEGWGLHFIASRAPLESLTAARAARQMPEAARRDLMEWAGDETVPEYIEAVLSKEIPLGALLAEDPEIRITDDRPLNEYYLLRRALRSKT
ncbi:MAG: fused MFS/spermidine synthase [Elusimicrobia bacterium]|nr:fused MFS/spermidine synthase [Elusimicrobiota bacterium]